MNGFAGALFTRTIRFGTSLIGLDVITLGTGLFRASPELEVAFGEDNCSPGFGDCDAGNDWDSIGEVEARSLVDSGLEGEDVRRFSRGTLITRTGRGDNDSRLFVGLVSAFSRFSLSSWVSVASADSTCSIRRFFGLKVAAGLIVGSIGIGEAGFWYCRNIAGGAATLLDPGLGLVIPA